MIGIDCRDRPSRWWHGEPCNMVHRKQAKDGDDRQNISRHSVTELDPTCDMSLQVYIRPSAWR